MASEALNPFERFVCQDLFVQEPYPCQNKDAGCSLCRKRVDGRDMKEFMELSGVISRVSEFFVFPHGQRKCWISARP
jgi:hypothetical protein